MSLVENLVKLLKSKDTYLAEDKLLKNKVIEDCLKLDEELLKLLFSNKDIEEAFFTKINDIAIFDKDKFIRFISNKEFLPDSYTAFKNRIGLTSENEFIKDTNDVVLNFPYKDCILEGGQNTEEKGRNEIFWNETLAPDEIDRLLDNKVFTNFKRYTQNGEEEVLDITSNDNLILKGNNLLALHSLKKKYEGKIKLIYIDPPYNTGNDSFKYNDKFNHSTWLTFMKNRLEVARELLNESGTIAISIDNNELNYLHILLDEIFGLENRKNLITVKRSSVSGAKVINSGVVNVSEYVIIYSKNKSKWNPNKVFREKERDNRYNKFIINKEENYEEWKYSTILEAFSDFKSIKKSQLKKVLGNEYEIELENFIYDNSEKIIRFAALDDKAISKGLKEVKYISKSDDMKTYQVKRENFSNYYLYRGEAILFFEDRLIELDGKKVFGELITDIWDDVLPNDLHNEGGVSLKKGKKPERLLERLVELFSNQNDLILDYHLGSGTTCAVAQKLKRKYIGIEQMNYIESLSVQRLKNVINGDITGISKSVNWQGGGEFIYAELKELNYSHVKQIAELKSNEKALEVFEDILENGFIDFKINLSKKEEIIEFIKAEKIDKVKDFLHSILDKNQMYLNYSEIEDKTYNVSEEDKKLNTKLYTKGS